MDLPSPSPVGSIEGAGVGPSVTLGLDEGTGVGGVDGAGVKPWSMSASVVGMILTVSVSTLRSFRRLPLPPFVAFGAYG